MKQEHQDLHQKFVTYGKSAREWMRRCVLLLPEIEKQRIWEKKGFGSIYEYVAKLAGMGHDTVNDALRILRKTESMPTIRKVIELKGIGAVKPVETIVTLETEKFWAEKAQIMSKHTLEIYVREMRKIDEVGRPGTSETLENPQRQAIENFYSAVKSEPEQRPAKKIIAMELEPELLEKLEKLKGQGSWDDLMKELLSLREEKLEQQKPEAVTTKSRHIPRRIQKYVLARTNGHCSFPACTKPSEIFHHTQRFALEKIHDPERLQPLCKAHERIAHHGLIDNEEQSSNLWKVREEPDPDLPKFQIDELVQVRRFASMKLKQ